MMEDKSCLCNNNSKRTVFSCSGAADVGEISDLVARKIHNDNVRQMKCLAFVSAGIKEMIDSIRETDMLVIDGCKLDCGKLTMERNGISEFHHLRLSDLGYAKGQSPAIDETIEKISEEASIL